MEIWIWIAIGVIGYIFVGIVHGVAAERLIGKQPPNEASLPWVWGIFFPLMDAFALVRCLIVGVIMLAIWIGEQIAAKLQRSKEVKGGLPRQ